MIQLLESKLFEIFLHERFVSFPHIFIFAFIYVSVELWILVLDYNTILFCVVT